ncbi:MAG: hypothetical protein IPG91_17455 [Ideonella sp.]|nr:hypothetical protein [Ideonella sp.]
MAYSTEEAMQRSATSRAVVSPTETSSSRVRGGSPLLCAYTVGAPSLLSEAARLAIGEDGVERLERFAKLRANWDGQGARTLNADSVVGFSQFFRDTGLRPDGLAVFMSQQGHVAVNWLDQDALVELEFATDGVRYYFERTGAGSVASSYTIAAFFEEESKSAVAA